MAQDSEIEKLHALIAALSNRVELLEAGQAGASRAVVEAAEATKQHLSMLYSDRVSAQQRELRAGR